MFPARLFQLVTLLQVDHQAQVGDPSPTTVGPLTLSPGTVDALKRIVRVGGREFMDRMDEITSGPAAVPYAVGWSLVALGFVFSLSLQQTAALSGKKPDHGAVIGRAMLAAIALASYKLITQSAWWGCSTLANQIYDTGHREQMGVLMESFVTRTWTTAAANYIPVVGQLYNIRNLAVDFLMGFCLWASSFALDGLNTVQVCVYNVLYCFGPLMIGLSVFGLPTGQIWLTAVLEICSWSITGSIVQMTMYTRFVRQFHDATTQGLLNFEWWDALKEMGFLTSLVFAVPILTSRLLGMTALGELSKTALGSNASMAMAGMLSRWGTLGGATGAPSVAPNQGQQQTDRPGD
jgi:hypothetical protein